MIKRILVGLGGTPFTSSEIRHAIELAQIHEAELTGVTVVDAARIADVGPIPIGGEGAAEELREHRLAEANEQVQRAITEFRGACENSGVRHRAVRETGDPFEEFTSLWRYHDLTIFGLRSLFEHGVVPDPKDALVRIINAGVRPIVAVAEQHRPIRRVMIAYNGSMEAAKSMKLFVQMRPWPPVELLIACFEFEADEARRLLNDACEYCRAHGHQPERVHVPGEAKTGVLEQAAAWNADLVVMGASTRMRILRRLMGDTALHTVEHAHLPLFITQ